MPDEHKSYEEGGWQSNYFEPMIVYFGGPEEEDLVEPGGGPARERADACGNKGSERPPQSARG